MILSGLKKYFVNLKYYFTPVGMLAVGLVLGLSVALPTAFSALKQFINAVAEIIQSNNVDFTATEDYIVNSITSLNWEDPIGALGTMINGEWLKKLIDGSFELIGVELKVYADLITQAFEEMVVTIIVLIVLVVFLFFAGLVAGYALTRYLVRRNMARRGLWKMILASLADSLLTVSLFALCVWLASIWTPSVAFTSVLSVASGSLPDTRRKDSAVFRGNANKQRSKAGFVRLFDFLYFACSVGNQYRADQRRCGYVYRFLVRGDCVYRNRAQRGKLCQGPGGRGRRALRRNSRRTRCCINFSAPRFVYTKRGAPGIYE